MSVGKIDITAEQYAIVQNILSKNISTHIKVWVFGSRVKNSAKKYSDLDLALENSDGSKIDQKVIFALQTDFEDSDLPWTVDVLDLNNITPEFRRLIEQDKVQFPPQSDKN